MRILVVLALALVTLGPGPLELAAPSAGGGVALGPEPDAPGVIASLVEPTSYGAITTINSYSGEPNIAAGPDGTVYVTGLSWGGTKVFRRLPGESSFTYRGVPNAGYGGNDEAVAVGPDGKVWISGMYGFFSPQGACISATGSSDRGTTWGATVPGLCDLEQGVDRQWIAADDAGDPWVVVHEVCCVGQHAAYRSTDGGVTFQLVSLTAVNGAFPGNLFVDRANDRIFEATNCGAILIRLTVCVLTSPTIAPLPAWTEHAVARYQAVPTGLAHVAGAADDAGNVYVTWIDKAPTELRHGVYLARSTNGGLTWSTPARISDTTKLGTMPWVAAGAGGNVAVVWFETTATATDPNTAPSTAAWHVQSATIKGWTGETMPAPTLLQLSTLPLKYGRICTTGASCPANRELLDFFEATVGPTGTLHVVWPDVANGWVLRVADVDADLR